MNSEIEKFYVSEELSSKSESNFWQHWSGLFQWHISRKNVSLCCTDRRLDKIIWPNIKKKEMSGGL